MNHLQKLYKHLPTEAVEVVFKFINDFNITLRITSSRKTKLGDYMPPHKNSKSHKISVNGNLPPDFFLVVFIHELAHLMVWHNFKRAASPHGKEWKAFYGELIRDFLNNKCFNEEMNELLYKFSFKPKATFASDHNLWKYLKKISQPESNNIYIGDLPEGAMFTIPSGRLFQKEAKIRTRYRCKCVKTKRWFLFHPLAEIYPLSVMENQLCLVS